MWEADQFSEVVREVYDEYGWCPIITTLVVDTIVKIHRHCVLVVLPTTSQARSARSAHGGADESMREANTRSSHEVKMRGEYRKLCPCRIIRIVVQATVVITQLLHAKNIIIATHVSL